MTDVTGHPVAIILGLALAGLACLGATSPTIAQPAALSAPPFQLVGVIIPEAGEPMAITEDPQTHEQQLHPLGAEIAGGRLTKILKDRVVFTAGDVAIEVRLAGPGPPPPRQPIPVRRPVRRAWPTGPR